MQSFVLFVILLGVLITVHELGHFLIAKWLNVKVLRFSIGFGPKIVGFTRGETEYRIAWIPLGGYVKMAGELPHDEVDAKDAARGFLAQPPWKRALIIIGGPLFNLIFPILIYFFVFFGDRDVVSTRIKHVDPGLPAAEAGIIPGDKVVAVDGTPVATFERLDGILADRAGQQTRLTIERDGELIEKTLTPTQMFEVGMLDSNVRGAIGISYASPVPIVGVQPGSPAHEAGLRTFDLIVSVNGQPVSDMHALRNALKAAGSPAKLQVARSVPLELPGVPLIANPKLLTFEVPLQQGEGLEALGVESSNLFVMNVYENSAAAKAGLQQGDKLLAVNGKAIDSFDGFRAAMAKAEGKPFEVKWRSGSETKTATIQVGTYYRNEAGEQIPTDGVGVQFMPSARGSDVETVKVNFGVVEALRLSVNRLGEDIRNVGLVLTRLVSGDLPFSTVGGPIMMFQLASKASELGVEYYLGLMGLISVNLGIMNLLPIPILDGFALLSALWEAIRRRPIPVRAREVANMVGLAMLVILMVLVFKNDLTRWWS